MIIDSGEEANVGEEIPSDDELSQEACYDSILDEADKDETDFKE